MLKLFFSDASDYTHILTFSLGVMLVLTSLVLLFRRKVTDVNIRQERKNSKGFVAWANKNPALLTTFIGVFIGVDFLLLGCLLIGSLPAIHLGTAISNRLPSHVLQPILASILMILGIKFVFF